jgi:hypothetical protein
VGADNADGLAIELEIDLGMGKEPGLLTDFGRNRHLALRSDPHRFSLLLHVRVILVNREGKRKEAMCDA